MFVDINWCNGFSPAGQQPSAPTKSQLQLNTYQEQFVSNKINIFLFMSVALNIYFAEVSFQFVNVSMCCTWATPLKYFMRSYDFVFSWPLWLYHNALCDFCYQHIPNLFSYYCRAHYIAIQPWIRNTVIFIVRHFKCFIYTVFFCAIQSSSHWPVWYRDYKMYEAVIDIHDIQNLLCHGIGTCNCWQQPYRYEEWFSHAQIL